MKPIMPNENSDGRSRDPVRSAGVHGREVKDIVAVEHEIAGVIPYPLEGCPEPSSAAPQNHVHRLI